MKFFYIKRLIGIFFTGITFLTFFQISLFNAYNTSLFTCCIATMFTLIFYYIFISKIKNFSKALYIKNNLESINIYFDDKRRSILFSFKLSKEIKEPLNINFIIKENEYKSFLKILNKNTKTSFFYNNTREDLSLKKVLEEIKLLEKN